MTSARLEQVLTNGLLLVRTQVGYFYNINNLRYFEIKYMVRRFEEKGSEELSTLIVKKQRNKTKDSSMSVDRWPSKGCKWTGVSRIQGRNSPTIHKNQFNTHTIST